MMRKLATQLLACMLFLVLAAGAQATVLTFDDVPGANPATWDNPIPAGYGGLNWDQFDVLHESYHPNSGYDYGVVSGEWVAYNVYDNMAVVSDGLFDFNGAWLTSAWNSTDTLTVQGFLGGDLLYSIDLVINNLTPTWLQADFFGVDSLTFDTAGNHFAMDDFTFNAAPVPEPSTLLLLGAGIVGLGIYRKKKA